MNKKLFWGIAVAAVIVFGILFFPWKKETAKEEPPKTDNNAKWQEAEHTPYGKYPETVTYTLGKYQEAITLIFRQEILMKTTVIHVI